MKIKTLLFILITLFYIFNTFIFSVEPPEFSICNNPIFIEIFRLFLRDNNYPIILFGEETWDKPDAFFVVQALFRALREDQTILNIYQEIPIDFNICDIPKNNREYHAYFKKKQYDQLQYRVNVYDAIFEKYPELIKFSNLSRTGSENMMTTMSRIMDNSHHSDQQSIIISSPSRKYAPTHGTIDILHSILNVPYLVFTNENNRFYEFANCLLNQRIEEIKQYTHNIRELNIPNYVLNVRQNYPSILDEIIDPHLLNEDIITPDLYPSMNIGNTRSLYLGGTELITATSAMEPVPSSSSSEFPNTAPQPSISHQEASNRITRFFKKIRRMPNEFYSQLKRWGKKRK